MINKDRIIPITKCDLLSMFGTIMNLIAMVNEGEPADIIEASTIDGDYVIRSVARGAFLDQPVKSITFEAGAADGAMFFVPDYTFEGIYVNGEKVDIGADIDASSSNLYMLGFREGSPSVMAVTPIRSK